MVTPQAPPQRWIQAELAVPAYEVFASTDPLGAMLLQRMMAKLSTRRYRAGLEPVGAAVEASTRSTSKSAVSRRFVAATETALAEMLAADLSGLDLVAVMIDGMHFADHLCVVALGIGLDGTKHPLGVVEVTPRTPQWPRTCWSTYATGASTPPDPSCACSTGPRRWWQR